MDTSHFLSYEEIGFLITRLALVDTEFFLYIGRRSETLENLGGKMLPADKDMLRLWCWFVWFQRKDLQKAGVFEDDES